jgi:hypothetical protein
LNCLDLNRRQKVKQDSATQNQLATKHNRLLPKRQLSCQSTRIKLWVAQEQFTLAVSRALWISKGPEGKSAFRVLCRMAVNGAKFHQIADDLDWPLL